MPIHLTLPRQEINESIQNEVDAKLMEAIDYAEKSNFPGISEIPDEVYG